VTAVLDAGALIAIDKGDRTMGAMLRILQREGVAVHTSAAAVAQVWRDGHRQANLARVVPGLNIAVLDEPAAKRVGELLRASNSNDLVDAHVALLVPNKGSVFTSDEADIGALLRTRRVRAHLVRL
jgi:hypothetical protein